jgi:rhamnulokinase
MKKYYLAIDIGASGGRHILGWVEDGKLCYLEAYRFENGMVRRGGHLCWDHDRLFEEILKGLAKCGEIGKIPVSVAVDTWGVDFALLDSDGKLVGDTVAYRDSRTDGMEKAVFARMPEAELYRRTGIQTQPYNTIFQLMALKTREPGLLEQASTMLLTPDYLHYKLSGAAKTEYTIASTTGLLDAVTRDWNEEILSSCGFPRRMFGEIVPPGTLLGGFTPEVRGRVGYDAKVVTVCGHDTGSAVLAVPSFAADTLYISSGTWSLLGVEQALPDCSPESMAAGFTNEGGYGRTTRYLRNIMGLWMIQSVRKEYGKIHSYADLCELAERSDIQSVVDCNDVRFLAPANMTLEIQSACRESGQQVPETPGELAAVIYRSLAVCYRDTIRSLEEKVGVKYPSIHIVGGGSNNALLNRLTAEYTGKPVQAGPQEATAMGNLIAQMLADGQFTNVAEARECVLASV